MKTLFAYIIIVFLFVGCKTVHEVEYITKTEYRDRLQKDTTYVHDSIFISQRADTVFISKWHTQYIERIKTDSIYLLNVDSVIVEKPVYIEKKWRLVDKVRYGLFGAFFFVILVVIGMIVYKLKK